MIPDDKARQAALDYLAGAIETAHSANPESWYVAFNGQSGVLRLGPAWPSYLFFDRRGMRLALDPQIDEAVTAAVLQAFKSPVSPDGFPTVLIP